MINVCRASEGFINVCRVSGGLINIYRVSRGLINGCRVSRKFYILCVCCISVHTVVAVAGQGRSLLSASCWSGSKQRGW